MFNKMLLDLAYSKRIRDSNTNLHSTVHDRATFKLPGNRSQAPTHETRPFLIGTKTKSFHRNDHDRIPTQARSRNERNRVAIVATIRQGRLPHRAGSSRWNWKLSHSQKHRRKRDARKATL